TNGATVTLSADATIGALRSRVSGSNNVFRLDINNKTLTLFRTIDGDVTSGNGATHVEYQVGNGVGSAGTLDVGGDANLAPTSTGMTVLQGVTGSNSQIIFRGNVTLGANARTNTALFPGKYVVDG